MKLVSGLPDRASLPNRHLLCSHWCTLPNASHWRSEVRPCPTKHPADMRPDDLACAAACISSLPWGFDKLQMQTDRQWVPSRV